MKGKEVPSGDAIHLVKGIQLTYTVSVEWHEPTAPIALFSTYLT